MDKEYYNTMPRELFIVYNKCVCGNYLGHTHGEMYPSTTSYVGKISCLSCKLITDYSDNKPPLWTLSSRPIPTSATARKWSFGEATISHIADGISVIPKIHTIKKIEGSNGFSLTDFSTKKYIQYMFGVNSLGSLDRTILMENNNKSEILKLFDFSDPEFKYNHFDSCVTGCSGIYNEIASEIIITYTTISYEEEGITYDVKVIDK
jgi:hypothetical protein